MSVVLAFIYYYVCMCFYHHISQLLIRCFLLHIVTSLNARCVLFYYMILLGLKRWWENESLSDFKVYGASILIALMIRTFIAEPRLIPSLSMFPTLQVGDQLAVDKISKYYRTFNRGDVVVFHPTPEYVKCSGRPNAASEALIKRIVAVEGDSIEIKNGYLYLNGQVQHEEYILEAHKYNLDKCTVPPGCVFVLGDNRNHSLDGHIWVSFEIFLHFTFISLLFFPEQETLTTYIYLSGFLTIGQHCWTCHSYVLAPSTYLTLV